MKDSTGGWAPGEYEQYIKELRKRIGIFVLVGTLIGGAKYIDYRNSFKDEGINEIYLLEEPEVIEENPIRYEESSINYNVSLDPYLISEDSTSFAKRIIRNDNPVKKLKKRKGR